MIERLDSGAIILRPAYQLPAPQTEPDQDDEQPIIDQPSETMRDNRTGLNIEKGTDIFWTNERKCRANACELLEAAIEYIDNSQGNGQAAEYLPGSSEMGWSGSKHDWYKKPIADYFVSAAGKGSKLDSNYPTLSALLKALRRHEARVKVYVRNDKGTPIPLLPNVAV